MKATEIRDKIFQADSKLHEISNALIKDIEWDGIDPVYLNSKMISLVNTAKHIQGQIKHLKK